jgi:hypothetical protein
MMFQKQRRFDLRIGAPLLVFSRERRRFGYPTANAGHRVEAAGSGRSVVTCRCSSSDMPSFGSDMPSFGRDMPLFGSDMPLF